MIYGEPSVKAALAQKVHEHYSCTCCDEFPESSPAKVSLVMGAFEQLDKVSARWVDFGQYVTYREQCLLLLAP